MIVIITGPTGAGKTTLERRLIQENYYSLLSYTTRKKRINEVSGKDFHYVKDRETFEKLVADGKIIEYTDIAGHYYGTSTNSISRAIDMYKEHKKKSVGVFDPVGALKVAEYLRKKEIEYSLVYIDIKPDVAQERMIKRFDEVMENVPDDLDSPIGQSYLDEYSIRMASAAECQPTWSQGYPYDIYVPESMNDNQLGQTVIEINHFNPPENRMPIAVPIINFIPGKPLMNAYRAQLAQHFTLMRLQQQLSAFINSPALQSQQSSMSIEVRQELSTLYEKMNILTKQFEKDNPFCPSKDYMYDYEKAAEKEFNPFNR